MNSVSPRSFLQRFPLPLLTALLLLAGCATGPKFYSEDYLAGISEQQFSQLKQELPRATDPEAIALVERVSRRIANAVADEMPAADWEFVLFRQESANAFAMPGGKIGVFTGLLNFVDSDAELAAVIGHEIAHVELEHANQRMSAEALRALGGVGAVVLTEDMEEDDRNKVLLAYGIGTQLGAILPYSRYHEREADRRGLMIAARAGYDPRAAIAFWEKMQGAGGSAPPEFLSTHPSYRTRLQTLREAMPAALEIYRANRPQL